IKIGNDQIQDAMMHYGARGREDELSISNIKATERSTTGVAGIQFDENRAFLTYVHAGDCMIFLQYENGAIRTLTHDVVQYLDQQAIQEVQRLREMPEAENVQIESYVAKIKPTLIENRKKMNTNDGYSVLDG